MSILVKEKKKKTVFETFGIPTTTTGDSNQFHELQATII